MFSKTLIVVGLLAQLVSAHFDPAPPRSVAELKRREFEASRRHEAARNCDSQIAEFNARRMAKRSLSLDRRELGGHFPRQANNTPTFPTIQNSTCVTAPEVTEGPYYIANELLRSDVRESQSGVNLVLDIGVMDTRTCTPLQNALVEIWACNATGAYSGFTTPPTRGNSMSDQFTWLRGGFATNSEGMVEFRTIYPGYYTGRAIHIHSMVQTNYQVDTNGSIVSHAGQVRHMGQIYFDEGLNDQVLAHSAYQGTSQRRTRNAQDGILSAGSGNGYNAIASTSFLGNSGDVNGGILAYITLGVDTSFQGSINSNNYVTSVTNPAAPTGVSSQGSNGASTTSAAWGSLLLITGNFMMQIMGF
ncbi:protocatechuate 3,4-dioxygenase beta subunit, putative [Rhizoctonia solani AG-3 Rhs1AP]|uniref:Protocatechuate 3,4-dioxygenase beta subunit, putative n=2 Tax=Rhizoctonia solani AG-3 TaxID=1086053 RepID=X8JDE7_9AGAM|nr:protocatechuate 3,4-dioxygenase beta subunit, putative [Rhizoctonia solani AG-3 Rhs1AP]KEP50514.1 putative protocatechuate 3,4-dioxygenase beta subunit [Rhizoctonia solani 123E]